MNPLQVGPMNTVDATSCRRWHILLVACLVNAIVCTPVATPGVVRVSDVASGRCRAEIVRLNALNLAEPLVFAHHLQELLVLVLGQHHSLALTA